LRDRIKASGSGTPSNLLPYSCPVPPTEEGGAVCWCRARAGSALGLGTPSSVEAGYVQSGLEPGAEDRGPCSACFET
jgi:hypothetical protein